MELYTATEPPNSQKAPGHLQISLIQRQNKQRSMETRGIHPPELDPPPDGWRNSKRKRKKN